MHGYRHCSADGTLLPLMGLIILALLWFAPAARAATPDLYEDDDSFIRGNTIEVDAPLPQYHNFHDAGDRDWVSFQVQYSSYFQIITEDLEVNCDTILELYGPWPGDSSGPGPLVAVNDDWIGLASEIAENLLPGTYFVQVMEFGDTVHGDDTGYDLRVTGDGCQGEVLGSVTDAATGLPVQSAQIRIAAGAENYYALTDSSGAYRFEWVPAGVHNLTISRSWYYNYVDTVAVVSHGTTRKDAALAPRPGTGALMGNVYNGPTLVPDIGLRLDGFPLESDPAGFYSIRTMMGNHQLYVHDPGYEDYQATGIIISAGQTTVHHVHLIPWADNDADLMNDTWENSYPCVDAGVDDGAGDPDADGQTNLSEYTDRANPCEANYSPAPNLINYQGRLTDNAGLPVSDTVAMTFSLFDRETAGSRLWTEGHAVMVTNGIYSLLLGGTTAIPAAAMNQPDLFLEITVANETLSPRQRLTTVPRAMDCNRITGKRIETSARALTVSAPFSQATVHVYFDQEFAGPPTVMVTSLDGLIGDQAFLLVRTYNITTEGFDVEWRSLTSAPAAGGAGFGYYAIGE